jgi:hypothetical protein
MMKQAPVFEEICKKYLADVSAINLSLLGKRLGIDVDGDTTIFPFFDIPHRVSGKGLEDACMALGGQPSQRRRRGKHQSVCKRSFGLIFMWNTENIPELKSVIPT